MSIFQVESLAFQRHQIHSAIFVVTINQKFILYLYEDGTNERYVECDSLKHFLRAINARFRDITTTTGIVSILCCLTPI